MTKIHHLSLFLLTLVSVWMVLAPLTAQALPVQLDEDIVFPTCGHFDQREQVWMTPIRSWIYEPRQKLLVALVE